MAKALLAAPTLSRVWERLVSPGENVRRGQELARYLDCFYPVVAAANLAIAPAALTKSAFRVSVAVPP
jgi:hypothetical protein